MADNIKLVNHSSILINNNEQKILTDPWYSGSSFNDGWSLLYENEKKDIEDLLYEVNFIYISHEHPDHFSIKFFKEYGKVIKEKKIKIIFQSTQDKRVESFLKKLDFELIILDHKEKFKISKDGYFTIIKQGHIDSAFLYETNDCYHININDCNFIESELNDINKLIEDRNKKIILYIQFSYASFRGNDTWLKEAAQYKLNNIIKLNNIFKSSLVVPFASFFYFSHSENQNLNKFANNCTLVSNYLKKNEINFCFLNPTEDLTDIDNLIKDNPIKKKINERSKIFWDTKISTSQVQHFEKNPSPILNENIEKFLFRLKKFNNFFLLFLIRIFSLKKIFGDLFVKINNTNDIYVLNFFKVQKILNKKKADISMSSESFNLLLNQPFGIESLLVSGRLKSENNNGLKRLTSAIGITTINLANYGINFKDIFNRLIFNKVKGLIYRALTQKS